MIPRPRQTPEDVEVGHIMEGEEAGLPIYAALGARPKRPLPPLPVPPPKPSRLRVVAEVHPSSRSSESSTYFEVEEEGRRGRVEDSYLCRRTRGPEAEKTPTRGGWTIFLLCIFDIFYWLVIDFSIFLQYFVLFEYFFLPMNFYSHAKFLFYWRVKCWMLICQNAFTLF